jgi:hypothetical protein
VTTCGGTVASAKIVELDVAADQQCEDERDRLRHQLPRGERQRPRGRAIVSAGFPQLVFHPSQTSRASSTALRRTSFRV